ncbi:MAG: transglycosylase SLT domain-containing protein [Burkholderiaceae bacterium]|nr:transglycosylase SLT domain-containing protein [Burkholderiaceae bacterium]
MVVNSQRYQKNQNFSGARAARRHKLGVWLALSIGLTACAGAEKPAVSADQTTGVLSPNVAAQVQNSNQLLATASSAAVVPPLAPVVVPAAARQAVVDARAAMQKKQWPSLKTLVPVAQDDTVLGTYANYWLLRQQILDSAQPVPDAQIQQFMQVNQDDYLADKIKGDWIVAAVRSGNYSLGLNLAPVVSSNSHIDCSLLLARQQTKKPVNAEQAMGAFQPNRSCWSMLDQFASSKIVAWKHLEPVLRASLEENKPATSQRLAAVMFNGAEMVQYAALMKNPKKWLAGRAAPKGRAETELVTLALSRLARGSERDANAAYVESQWAHAVPKANLEWVWSQFGLVSALNVEPQAANWYRRSGNARLTDYNHAWQVRSELRQRTIDWDMVAKSIRRMSAKQAAEPVWVYWYARALQASGNQKAASQHYASISTELSFYGQLASEELGVLQAVPSAPAPVTATELLAARSNTGLQRAIALFDLGWRPEAVPEWNFALRGMTDRQLLAAAELARQEHIYDRVVNTSLRTQSDIDFSQRFIAPFEGKVTEKARLVNLDPAWVYGLIRQESRFITDARSHVGASGLMQLMPATAKWVAKKIGMQGFTPSSVNDFDTNTILGTSYLSMVLGNLGGSEVLASAGYNAGPGRPVQWRSKLLGPVEGAIFAETIPFTETRMYVKNVLSNATYYAAMFSGQPHSLKQRLGTISPAPSKQVALP